MPVIVKVPPSAAGVGLAKLNAREILAAVCRGGGELCAGVDTEKALEARVTVQSLVLLCEQFLQEDPDPELARALAVCSECVLQHKVLLRPCNNPWSRK